MSICHGSKARRLLNAHTSRICVKTIRTELKRRHPLPYVTTTLSNTKELAVPPCLADSTAHLIEATIMYTINTLNTIDVNLYFQCALKIN